MTKYINLKIYLYLLIATALWGGNVIAAKIASNLLLEPIKLSFYRNIVVIIILLPFIITKYKYIYYKFINNWKIISLLSVLGVTIFNASMNTALTTSSVISTSIMPSFAPSLIILFSLIIYNTKISFIQFIGVSISFIGFANIIIRGDIYNLESFNFVKGDLWMLGCVCSWACYSALLKKSPKDLDNISFLFLIFFIGNLFLLPFFIYESHINNFYYINEKYGWYMILYVAIGPALISFLLWIKSVKIIGANKSGLFLNLIPVFSSLISIIFLDESLEKYHIIGALFIFIGIYLIINQKHE